jgi:hypothetical protein
VLKLLMRAFDHCIYGWNLKLHNWDDWSEMLSILPTQITSMLSKMEQDLRSTSIFYPEPLEKKILSNLFFLPLFCAIY